MTSRFRPWHLAAGLVTLCVIGVAIAVYLRRSVELPVNDLVSYMPRRESTVAYLDLRTLRRAQILDKLVGGTVSEEPDYKQFVTETKFDYKSDLDQVVYCRYGTTSLFLLSGRFDWKALSAYNAKLGGTCKNGFCRAQTSTPDRRVSFYPVNSNLMALAFSTDEWAAAEIKPRPGEKLTVEIPNQPLWVRIPGASFKAADALPAGTRLFARALSDAEHVLLTLGPEESRFELLMDVTCKNEEQAAILRSQLEGITELLKKLIARENQTPNPGDLSGILTSGTFHRSTRHVLGKWPVERSFLDSLAAAH